MNQKPAARSIYRLFSIILLLSLLFSSMNLVKVSVVRAQEPDTMPPLSIGLPVYHVKFVASNADILPKEAGDAIETAMNIWPDPGPENNTFYLIDLNWHDRWATVTLTSANLESSSIRNEDTDLNTSNLFSAVIVNNKNAWKAAIEIDPNLQTILDLIPDNELSQNAKSAIFSLGADQGHRLSGASAQQTYNNYKFPWPAGQAWRLTNGWHDSTTWGNLFPSNTSLDFDISGGEGTNSDIKAAASGTLTYRCTSNVDDQALVYITTDGTTEKLGYLHLSKASLRFGSGAHVNQGDVIGRMASMDNGTVRWIRLFRVEKGSI